ncbi:MAG: cytochrome c biogenesis protein CcsA [Bacteroidia bacterium]
MSKNTASTQEKNPSFLKKNGWKIITVLLLYYVITMGLLHKVPRLPILHETIRNLYFHVCMWFGMIFILSVSLVQSLLYLSSNDIKKDILASQAANTGILYGFLGLATGSLWAKFTWGAWWINDPKLDGAAVSMLIYVAYLILRSSIDEEQKRARISAVYNIFAYIMLIVFLLIYPRMHNVDSLHPGNGGNPGFNKYDLNSDMRIVFYPAVIGWVMLAWWITTIRVRIEKIKRKLYYND